MRPLDGLAVPDFPVRSSDPLGGVRRWLRTEQIIDFRGAYG